MSWIEGATQLLTNRVEYLFRLLQDLVNRVRALEQGLQRAFQQQSGSSSSTAGVYFADHLSIAAASGLLSAPPTIHSTTGDVYRINGGAVVSVAAGATIYNGMPDATDSAKRQILCKNDDGTYTVVTQSCTNS